MTETYTIGGSGNPVVIHVLPVTVTTTFSYREKPVSTFTYRAETTPPVDDEDAEPKNDEVTDEPPPTTEEGK